MDADALRVRQILRNLISNAVRYGGDTLEILAQSKGHEAEVIVRDDGEGIAAEDASTIFLPYRRSKKSPRTGTSVGLGLWISRQLAERMGGTLDYRRRDDRTEFVLTLPVITSELEPSAGINRDHKREAAATLFETLALSSSMR